MSGVSQALYQLAYVSSATALFRTADLVSMLEQARELNARDDLTGLLLYRDGAFIQVLEGERERVHAAYERISADPRHTRVTTLIDAPAARREFPDWRMGFFALDDPAVLARPDVSGFLTEPLSHESFVKEPSRARRLLWMFKLKS